MTTHRTANPQLRDAIVASGWTYEALARAVRRVAAENGEVLPTNKSAVAHWISGLRRPSGRTALYLAEAMSRRIGRPVPLTELGLAAHAHPVVGDPTGDDPIGTVVELAHNDLRRTPSTPLADAVFTVAGVATPLDYDHDAVSRMLRARTTLTTALAQQALSLKQPRHCTDLIAAALKRATGHLDGHTQALLHVTHARALALNREPAPAARALLAAEDALANAHGPQASFTAVSGPADGTVASHTARALTEMGDHTGAKAHHQTALRRWDPERYQRVHILTHADLGDTLAERGRPDEAIHAWGRALDLTTAIASDRVRKAMMSTRPLLATYRRHRVPGAAELDHRIRDACR